MIYQNIKKAEFISRPNRFIANIKLEGKTEICHVKNTGRCKELLLTNAVVCVQEAENPSRKTKFDLISVYKGKKLINIDSSAPNKVFFEWVQNGNLFKDVTKIRPELKHGDSRFDFYIEADGQKIFVEVKGATLEENGVVLFPDAPTERGVKHLNGLCDCVREGFSAYVVFVIQMRGVKYFTPNVKTHKAFGDALKTAAKSGVNIIAIDCDVTENSITANNFVEVKL